MSEIAKIAAAMKGQPISDMMDAHIAWAKHPDREGEQIESAIATIRERSPFFMEQWAPGLTALSIQSEIIRLPQKWVEALNAFVDAMIDGKDFWAIADYDLVKAIGDAIGRVGGSAFVRLGSRSPKDNTLIMREDMRPMPVYSGRQAMEAMGYSERVFIDLLDARRANYMPVIAVRRWLEIPPECEFRCFVTEGKISGMTQYYCEGFGPSSWIIKNATAIEAALRSYLTYLLIPLSGLSSFTADIILTPDFRATLLEINPPVETGSVYPGLFGLAELDGSFRYMTMGAT